MRMLGPALLIVSLAFAILVSAAGVTAVAQTQTVGLFVNDTAASPGYTLFGPNGATTTYLIDMNGHLVHSWANANQPGVSVYLLENGNLLRTAKIVATGGGAGGMVQEIAWDGSVVWEFVYSSPDYLHHHDIEPLPNGNVLLLAWEYKTLAEVDAAGRDTIPIEGPSLWPEHVIEVAPTGPTSGDIVWEWHLWDHLVQDWDSTKANFGVVGDHPELVDLNYADNNRGDWIHGNSLDYSPSLDQIIISAHRFNEFWIIDHSTTTGEAVGHTGGNSGMGGDLLYRWGNPITYAAGDSSDQQQYRLHDPHWIPEGLPGAGNIMLFDNGNGRPDSNYSAVDEIVTPVDVNGDYPQPSPGNAHGPTAPAWSYIADPATSFYSRNVSGSQRMPNGNTLICEGANGRFFEVTSDSQIVWEYINPVSAGVPVAQGDTLLSILTFRCARYAADYPGLAGHDLTPGATIETYGVTIVGTEHEPASPGAADSVVITTTMTAFGTITIAELHIDTGSGFFVTPLFDDGNHQDGAANDDLFGAILPPWPSTTPVDYYIYAETFAGLSAPDPANPPTTTYHYAIDTACVCFCYADPACDGVTNVLDVVASVNVAFRGSPAIQGHDCPGTQTDINCDAVTNVLDVVRFVNVAFRGGDPAVVFCVPCAP